VSDHTTYLDKPALAFTARSGAIALVLQSPVQVSEAFDPQSNVPRPAVQTYTAIWDTGATNTVITSKVVTELGLKPSGKVKVRGVGAAGAPQEHDSNTYLINILLPNNVSIVGVRVSENTVDGCDVLVGMDVITTGDLAITNHNNKTTFSFRAPACEEIDFVTEIDAHNQRLAGVKPPLSQDEQRKFRNKQKAQRRKGR
jgi:gag-polyprotein putative aspartyl protease